MGGYEITGQYYDWYLRLEDIEGKQFSKKVNVTTIDEIYEDKWLVDFSAHAGAIGLG